MADAKQILVVDDHFEMLEFLRSMLELSNRDYQVVGVPSGEEGYLELRRTPFDLLITDVRLPGMSGFELLRKVRPFRPGIPVIMITAYYSAQGKQEATDLGVFRYFQKPLNTDALLTSVRAALYGEEPQPVAVGQPAGNSGLSTAAKSLATDIRNRLEALRADTGASQVVLAKADGTTLFEIGTVPGLTLAPLVRIVAGSLDNSFRLAEQLGSNEPFNIQYQAGQQVDLYSANIGRDYFLIIIYDAKSRRGRIGTVWVFAQRTIKELQPLLGNRPSEAAAAPPSRPVARVEPLKPTPAPSPRPVAQAEPLKSTPPPSSRPVAQAEPPKPIPPPPLTPEEIAAANELAKILNSKEPIGRLDLDSFWSEAVHNEDVSFASGLSLEEAIQRGLIPPEFGG